MTVLRCWHLAVLALPLTLTTLSFGEGSVPVAHSPIPPRSRQMLLVRSVSWSANVGTLQRYLREPNASWQAVGEALQVNLGKRGMAWGRGLHAAQAGPSKVEGDNRTPAGVFRLGSLFGYAPDRPANAAPKYPYIHIGVSTVCIENPQSPLYNEIIDAAPTEFPRHRGSLTGKPYRFGYAARPSGVPEWPTLKYDLHTGESTVFHHGHGRGGGEPVFVSRPSPTAEDDGWLITFVHDVANDAAELVVLDAQDFGRGAVARVLLPQRVPYGFHGNWVSDRSVPPT